MVPGDSTETLQRCGGYTYEQGELRGAEGEERRGEERRGEERRGKEKDGCPLTASIHIAYKWGCTLTL
jgi:hypothetical protein